MNPGTVQSMESLSPKKNVLIKFDGKPAFRGHLFSSSREAHAAVQMSGFGGDMLSKFRFWLINEDGTETLLGED